MTDRYRYFRLESPAVGEWPSDHPISVGTIQRLDIFSGDALTGYAWNDITKDWVFPRWVEVSDPALAVPHEQEAAE